MVAPLVRGLGWLAARAGAGKVKDHAFRWAINKGIKLGGGGGMGVFNWFTDKGVDWVNVAANISEGMIPSVETKAYCVVHGMPHSTRKDLHKFALSLLFSMVKRRRKQGAGAALPPAAVLIARFDMVRKIVHVEVSYRTSALGNLINAGAGVVLDPFDFEIANDDTVNDSLVCINGTEDKYIGDAFTHQNWLERRFLGGVPKLPGEGKILLTDDPKTVNPAPPGDLVSRGLLEFVVFESIRNPPSLINHAELIENDPRNKVPGAVGAYTPAKDLKTPRDNAPVPVWEKFWAAKNVTPPKGM
ncbi:hypothetical protein [Limnoglobus roseus]|uniref:Uncharacterized protein n=1 Tax=Limnoglobus roseus TaxID=2598579 RepID=A0A5C1AMX9_9BACT|nr:hypothetical protein [Limnoglobus roseus]QEL19082.1 hypothetical protein PX52LOC_06139 [Limnoglobus roseus]